MVKSNGAQKAAIESARQMTLANPDQLLGVMTWWSISEVLVPREELKARCAKIGLNSERFLINSRPRSAFRRALEEAESLNLVRKIVDNPESIVFGVVNETADQVDLDLTYSTEDVVIFNKSDQTLTFKMKNLNADEIRAKFDKYLGSYTSHEVRSMIHAELRRQGAFPVRDKGGLYFVGKDSMEMVEKMRELVETFKNGSFLYVMGVRDEDLEKQGMQRSWQNALDQEIKTMKQEISNTISGSNNFRAGTLAKRGKTLQELKKKIEVYSGLFGSDSPESLKEVEDLLEKVSKANKTKFGEGQGKRKVKVVGKKNKTEKPVEVAEKAKEEAATK